MSEDYGVTYSERMRSEGRCVGCGEIPDTTHYLEWQLVIWRTWGWCAPCAATLDELTTNTTTKENKKTA